jgi:SAM-dependent methyltransferase
MRSDYQQETFDLEESHWWYKARRRIIVDTIVRTLGPCSGARLLDVGCGAGTILRDLSKSYTVTGIDLIPEAAAEASRRSGCRVVCGTIPDDIPADLRGLDGICLFDVIEHLDDDAGFLKEAGSLLKEGGFLFLTVPAIPWLYGQHDRINEHRRRYSRGHLIKTLKAGGYEVRWCSYFNFILSPLLIPVVLWSGRRDSGHNFDVRSRLEPLLEAILGSEKFLLRVMRFPFGLSLLAVAKKVE